jgi:hypothetical protein
LLLSISVLTPTPILLLPSFLLPSMSDHNARSRRFFGTTTFSQQTLAFCIIGSYPMLGIHWCILLSSLWCQYLGLTLGIQHICWERMLIDFHRLLGLGVVKLNSPRFDSRLQLLPEHLALICTMWSCIVSFVVLDLLQLFCRWNHMIGWQLNLTFFKQKIKYPIGFGDVKGKLLWFFLTKRTRYQPFILNPLS